MRKYPAPAFSFSTYRTGLPTMRNRSVVKKKAIVDYQRRAWGFSIGDVVVPFGNGGSFSNAGRVTTVFPAIGMVDVEFPTGSLRFPVEDLQILSKQGDPNNIFSGIAENAQPVSIPGGLPTALVDAGPLPGSISGDKVAGRVAAQYLRRQITAAARNVVALYWGAPDRKYRCSQSELQGGKYLCPRCKCEETGERNAPLIRVPYRRENGVSERLYICPSCTFTISANDILLP